VEAYFTRINILYIKTKMKIAAVIPVHGRKELLKYTIQRLMNKNVIVIAIGCLDDIKDLPCQRFVHENYPLGRKWNYGFQRAREYYPDAVLYVGSSDWISDNWIDVMIPYLEKFDMVGKLDYNLAHICNKITLLKFKGYIDPKLSLRTLLIKHSLRQFFWGNDRILEPIGIGRLIRSSFLDKINWRPFLDDMNSSMDWCMMQKLKFLDGTYTVYSGDIIQSLSISCNKWNNMHWSMFERYMPNMEKIKEPGWVEKWFPELLDFKMDYEK